MLSEKKQTKNQKNPPTQNQTYTKPNQRMRTFLQYCYSKYVAHPDEFYTINKMGGISSLEIL